ncbi:MAG: hypothetical protein WC893_00755 [Candidatus Paceibacterota bacterium]|jgi:hypothetical protein
MKSILKINKILLFILLGIVVFYSLPSKISAQGPIPDTRTEQEKLTAQLGTLVNNMEKLPSGIDSDDSFWTRVTGGIGNTTNNELDEKFYYYDRKLNEIKEEIEQVPWTPEQRSTIDLLLERGDRTTKDYLLARQEAIDNGISFQKPGIGTTEENRYAMNRFQELIRTNPEERDIAIPEYWEGTDEEYFEHIAGRQEIANEANEEIIKEIEENKNQCLYWFGINPMACVLSIAAGISTLILKIFGTILWISSSIFDLSIYISIVSFKSLIASTGIDAAWKVMRDLANLSFIFILLYIAISVIFDISIGGNSKKLIVEVIIIALLVNFSGFLVRVVIDASNVIAYEFYSRMSYDPQANEAWILDRVNANIGTALVSKLDLSAHVVPIDEIDDYEGDEVTTTRLGFFQIVIGSLGSIIIILMASFVLLAGSIMFLIRTVTLLFVYVFSPIGLTLRLIPMFKDSYTKWQDALLKQSFFAPAFLIPLFAVFKILGDKGLSTLAQDAGIGTGLMKITMIQLIVMAMIASCIFIAQKFGAKGLDFSKKWAGKSQASMVRYGSAGLNLGGKAIRKGSVKIDQWAGTKLSERPNVLTKALKTSTRRIERATAVPGGVTKTYETGKEKIKEGKKWVADTLDFKGQPSVPRPLMSINDYVSSTISKAGLVSGFNILGTDKDARKKLKEDKKTKTKEEKEEKEENRKEELKSIAEDLKKAPTKADVATIIRDKKILPNEIAKLPDDVLERVEVSVNLGPSSLNAIINEDKLDTLLATIKTNIIGDSTSPGYEYMRAGRGSTDW